MRFFATNSNFLIPISLQPDGVDLYCKDIRVKKSKFVAKTQFFWAVIAQLDLCGSVWHCTQISRMDFIFGNKGNTVILPISFLVYSAQIRNHKRKLSIFNKKNKVSFYNFCSGKGWKDTVLPILSFLWSQG